MKSMVLISFILFAENWIHLREKEKSCKVKVINLLTDPPSTVIWICAWIFHLTNVYSIAFSKIILSQRECPWSICNYEEIDIHIRPFCFLFYLIFITILYDIYSSIMSNIFIPVSKWQEKLPFRQINLLFIYFIWNLYFEKSFTTTSQIEDNKLIKILHLWSYPVFCIVYYFEKFSVLNGFCFCWLPFSNEFVGKMKKSVVI